MQTVGADPYKYQWIISLNGGDETVNLWSNDQATAANISFTPIFNDPAETQVYSSAAGALARYVPADSSFGGAPNYFVDWAIPRSALAQYGIDTTTSFFWFATSANANNFNKDNLDCPFSPSTNLNVSKSVSPSTISTGATSDVTYTIALTNTGGFGARGVTLSDADFPAWLAVQSVTTTAGTPSWPCRMPFGLARPSSRRAARASRST